MKSLPLEEAQKLATKGNMVPDGMDPAGVHYVTQPDKDPKKGMAIRVMGVDRKFDAALLAHYWNTYSDLVRALRIAQQRIGETEPCQDSIDRALKAASTVEIPE